MAEPGVLDLRVLLPHAGGDAVSAIDLSAPDKAFLSGLDCGRAVGHWEGWQDGYVEGYDIGHEDGDRHAREAVEDEWRGRHVVSAAVARMIATAGSYADLCDRRGEPEQAEQARALLRDRGIS